MRPATKSGVPAMLRDMTTTSTNCTPADLLANLPGILGFYPRESVVFAAFDQTSDPNRFLLGPVLRIDIDDLTLLPEVATSLDSIGPDLVFAFVIPDGEQAETTDVIEELFRVSEEGTIEIGACWLTREILTGETFRLAFGPSLSDLSQLFRDPESWEQGVISSITGSPAMGPLLRTGHLPELHRSEAFDYFNRFNPHFDDSEITALEGFAHRSATDLVGRIHSEADTGVGETLTAVITDFAHLLTEAEETAVSVAELMNDEEVLLTVAVYLSDSLLRDAVMGAAPRRRRAAMDLSLAVARTFSGTVRANALCLYAVAAVAAELSMRVVPALSAAQRAVPAHTLSSLLLDGAQHGMLTPMLDATMRGSEIVAEKFHAVGTYSGEAGATGPGVVDAA